MLKLPCFSVPHWHSVYAGWGQLQKSGTTSDPYHDQAAVALAQMCVLLAKVTVHPDSFPRPLAYGLSQSPLFLF